MVTPRRSVLALLCGGLLVPRATAGTPLLIWPIDPIIAPGQQAAALWLENHGAQPATLQVRVFGWQQRGEEIYEPQQAVLPSPPIASIAPGGRQLVRLISTRPVAPGTEQAFRIFIDELPAPDAPEAERQTGASVKLQLRYAVPLFVYGAGALLPLSRTRDGLGGIEREAMRPALAWESVLDNGKPVLVLANNGSAHARITAVEWSAGGQTQPVNAGLLGYVLAGSSMRFPIDKPLPRNAALRAQLNGRPADIPRAAD